MYRFNSDYGYDLTGGEMKKSTLGIIILCLIFSTTAYAGGEKSCESGFWSKILNECSPHTVDTDTHRDEKDAEIGVGVDVIVHEGEDGEVLNKVAVEYKYDINNDDHKTYAVATTKLSDVWAKVKSIFKKGE
jgi:hypothetical protein